MKKTLIASVLTLAFAANAVAADEHTKSAKSKNEMIGFGSGALAGAAVGGPVGGLLGGIFGILLADDVNDHEDLTLAKNQLRDKDQALAMLEKEYEQALQLAQQKAERMADLRLVSLRSELESSTQPVETSLQFKTASFAIEQHYGSTLDLIAENLKKRQDAVVKLEGYADRRGDADYNQQLSEQRVKAVQKALQQRGVNAQQISVLAFGEVKPVAEQQNFENDFFDRRVLIRVQNAEPVFTAANSQ